MRKENKDVKTENFMRNIAWLRKRYGISKKKMAELLGVGVGTVNKLERGEFPPRLSVSVMYNIWRHFHIGATEQFSRLWDK